MSETDRLSGPLGDFARQVHTRSGIDVHDAFAAAVCWWSAAVAPTVRTDWPVLVWGVFLNDEEQYAPSLTGGLRRTGLEDEACGPPHWLSTPGEKELFEAVDNLLQTDDSGDQQRSLLLTGNPLHQPFSQRRRNLNSYLFLRQAWDGKEYRPYKRQQSAPVSPPSLGVLWETSQQAWQQSTQQVDTATVSRLLHFRRRPTAVAMESADVRGVALAELAQARAWALQRRPRMSMDATAVQMLSVIRRFETAFDAPDTAKALVRVHAHAHRIAAVLALAERSSVIRGQHLQAAWSLARRSCLDVQTLLGRPGTGIGRVVEDVDTRLRTLIGVPREDIISPPRSHEPALISAGPESGTPEQLADEVEAAAAPVRRRSVVVDSQVRDGVIVKTVKQWYSNRCQMCGTVLRVPGPIGAYSEGAHIQALGHPHNGPDRVENLLCLCPNCHIQFDSGALYLTDDLDVIDAFTHRPLHQLALDSRHDINITHVRHHREYWTTGNLPSTAAPAEPGRDALPFK
ncbi:HNH endonuclease [Streptomyces sp. NPDC088770]|uniref:HNH endonuclease n=1 Tax=unclassified Streptomyces TaxID=2593676 RepID=UPI0038025D3E